MYLILHVNALTLIALKKNVKKNSAVKSINRIQNKCLCLHNMCVCVCCLFYLYVLFIFL